MKILAADDNPVARTVLRAFLEKSGYEPVVVEDGSTAIKVLQESEHPHIVILDWMMPGMSGPEVCAKLRAINRPIRPYVILLTAKNEKADIASGLDAGADEFITKPFNQVEMLARLRVAQRMVKAQIELQARIDELESMVQRHQLLGEIVAHRTDSTQTAHPLPKVAKPQPAGEDAEPKPEKVAPSVPPSLKLEEIGEALQVSLSDFGWQTSPVRHGTAEGHYAGVSMTAWSGMYVKQLETWIDFLLEVDNELATRLFEKSMRRPPTDDREVLNFLAETITMVTSKCKALLQSRECVSVSPFISRSSRQGKLSRPIPVPQQREVCSVEVEGGTLGLTVARAQSIVKQKTTGQLNPSDILAEPFQPSADLCLPLLNQGTILNERFIERLVVYSQNERKNLKLPVIEPTPVMVYFNPELQ